MRELKRIAWFMAMLLLAGLLMTGCGAEEPAPEPVVEPSVEAATASAAAPTEETAAAATAEPQQAEAAATPQEARRAAVATQGPIHFDFEDGTTQGWGPRGQTAVTLAGDVAHSGSQSLSVSGRTATWHGAMVNVLDLIEADKTYAISGSVILADGEPDSRLILTMQRRPSGGNIVYEWVAPSVEDGVTAAIWTELSGQYTFSGAVDELYLYVESPDAERVDFYLDDITITEIQIDNSAAVGMSPQTDIPSLRETFAAHFWLGAALEPDQLESTPHQDLLLRHFNNITAENAMKPVAIQPREGEFTWEGADKLVAFARANDLAVHGHTLVWHKQAAEWMFADDAGNPLETTPENKELVLQRLTDHIRAIVERYQEEINVWYVVNEVIDPAQENCLRRSRWYELTGIDYIVTAFQAANEAAPGTTLLLNDYNTTDPQKRACIYNLVKALQTEGVPIDGLGMQMHVNIESPAAGAVEETIETFAELGEVQITELDMSIYNSDTGAYSVVPEEVLIQQGYRYQELFEVFERQAPNIGSVTFWGLADDHTWLKTWPVTRLNAPLLFDEDLQAKHAYWGVIDPGRLPIHN